MTITKREILLSCGVIAVLLLIGFTISNAISDHQQSEVNRFETSVKVNDDNELFQYVLDTKQSNVCAYGLFDGGTGVTDTMIDGTYYSIVRIYEHYTRHTRTVTTKVGKTTTTRVEVYYTWDEKKRDCRTSTDDTFMGVPMDIVVDNYYELCKIKIDSNDRIVFKVIPLTQYGLIHPLNIEANGIRLQHQTMEEYEKDLNSTAGQWIFWIFLILCIGGLTIWIYYSDWDWLNR